MHVLDLIMYIPLALLLWVLMDKLSDGDYTKELGILRGWGIMIRFTIVYFILFVIWPDWNWIDIFTGNICLPKIGW